MSVDVGAIVDSYYGDSAHTFAVGEVDESKSRLMAFTRKCLQAGIDNARKGNKLGKISAAVQQVAESEGFGVVRQLVGHGIGRNMHEEPQVPNFGSPNDGPVLKEGMVLAKNIHGKNGNFLVAKGTVLKEHSVSALHRLVQGNVIDEQIYILT